jgi:hypothetical protein
MRPNRKYDRHLPIRDKDRSVRYMRAPVGSVDLDSLVQRDETVLEMRKRLKQTLRNSERTAGSTQTLKSTTIKIASLVSGLTTNLSSLQIRRPHLEHRS